MKRLLAVSLCLNAVLAFGLLSRELAVHAEGKGDGGGGGTPVGNGDVNGDGNIDLSDAVYTLHWLFLAGPAFSEAQTAMARYDHVPMYREGRQ